MEQYNFIIKVVDDNLTEVEIQMISEMICQLTEQVSTLLDIEMELDNVSVGDVEEQIC